MTEQDQLGRLSLVDEVVRTVVGVSTGGLKHLDHSLLSASRIVSIVGEWGSGKSWILERVRPELGGVTREFNPWLFSGEMGVYRGFAMLLIDQVEDKTTKAWLAETLDLVGPSLKAVGFDLSGSAAKLAELMNGDGSPSAIRARLSKAMSKKSGPTYILIDDIDRLTPDELLTLFKLLRLVGDIPGLVYVLAYDEETLLHLMARTEIAHDSPERARKYLDKIVETKILLPPLSAEQKRALMADQLVEFGRVVQPDLELADRQLNVLSYELERLTWRKLATVRVIERYLAAVYSLPKSLYGEVNFVDWAFVCYLRVVEPQVLQIIVTHSDSFIEAAKEVRGFGLAAVEATRPQLLAKSIRDCANNPMAGEELLEIILYLFPTFVGALKAEVPFGGDVRPDSKRHVGHPDYFYRYFQHELPPGVVSDRAIRELLGMLSGDSDAALSGELKLRTVIAENPYATIQSVSRHWSDTTTAPAYFRFVDSLYSDPLPGDALRTDWPVQGANALRGFDSAELAELGTGIDENLSSRTLLATILRSNPSGSSSHFRDWMTASRESWLVLLAERVAAGPSPTPDDPDLFFDAQCLRLADFDRFAAIAVERMKDKSWTAAGALLVCINVGLGESKWNNGIATLPRKLAQHRELMTEFRGAAAQGPYEYPPAWNDAESYVRRFEANESTPTLELANYLLTHWDSVEFAD